MQNRSCTVSCKIILRMIPNLQIKHMVFVVKAHLMKGSIGFELYVGVTGMGRFREGVLSGNPLKNLDAIDESNCFITQTSQ